ncbi:MAG TPA: VCBS repeat-containing protein [Planctomycetota bacterium]|nr:VCBS repeat-containing protein [Planctomycetota bacterium]
MTDVSAESGVTFVARTADPPVFIPEAKGGGVALFDQDADGRLDLLVVAGSTVEREARGEPGFGLAFYRGLGGARFRDATAEVGLDVPFGWLTAPVVGDADGDGRPDLLLASFRGLRLFRNDGARFVEAVGALPSAATDAGWCTSATWVDLDGDGALDLFACRYLAFDPRNPPRDGAGRTCRRRGKPVMCGPRGLEPLHDLVLRNRGDGTFEDASRAWGVADVPAAYGLGVVASDVDRDGDADVYVANDATPNHLWRNDGGRFVEIAGASGVAWSADGAPEAGMGVDAADLDGDGIEDFFVTNFETEPNDVYLSAAGLGWFEASMRVKTAAIDRPLVGWGCGIRDFDGDGRLDLFVANGHVYAGLDDATWAQPCTLHLGRPDGAFARFAGADAAALDAPRAGRPVAFGDLDDDGDFDAVVSTVNGPPAVLRADLPPGRWYGASVTAAPGRGAALGARATFEIGAVRREATVRAQSGFQATHDVRLLFRAPGVEGAARFTAVLNGRRGSVEARPDAYVALELPR